ncbi:hypothetical protein PSM7751_03694 [Pseudooceanicola marinus]|uniref:Uncharacterized protein n=3 Tax=Pseudooceanicola marinus TaxID=396013 RepID=A0A1X7A6K8_9RHOB|nr:hypothetical protein PSM7751_03694 [Pseudooceanicola marinus]
MAFIVGGVTAGTVASVGYPAGLSDFHLGARDAGGAGKPLSLTTAKLWIAPAAAYTVADMEALTA